MKKRASPQGEQVSQVQPSLLAVTLSAQVIAGKLSQTMAVQMLVKAKGIRRHG